MNHWLSAGLLSVAILLGSATISFSQDAAAPAGQPGAPVEVKDGASAAAGCMPGGGCCGSPACATPPAQQDQEKSGHQDAVVEGGCPCARAKQQKAM